MLRPLRVALLPLSFAFVAGIATPGSAVDGVIEINQACAVNTGCLGGDPPGLPVSIGSPGSYRLTGSLTLPDANTHGVIVSASDVTLDLNGFAIQCSSCATSGTGVGILGASGVANLTVRNGSVINTGGNGISFAGPGARIEGVRSMDNGFNGIRVGDLARISDCIVEGNGAYGIELASGDSVVQDSVSSRNGSVGIICAAASTSCTVRASQVQGNPGGGISSAGSGICHLVGNLVTDSGSDGISCPDDALVRGNVVRSNAGLGISVGANATITENSVSGNDGDGISTAGSSVISHNVSNGNGVAGIASATSLVSGNVANGNTNGGLVGAGNGYGDNLFDANNGGNTNAQTAGGLEVGSNVCGGDLSCP